MTRDASEMYNCTMFAWSSKDYTPACPVGEMIKKHNESIIKENSYFTDPTARANDLRRRTEQERKAFAHKLSAAITKNCRHCGFEYTEAQLRKLHPFPWVYDEKTGCRYRDIKERDGAV